MGLCIDRCISLASVQGRFFFLKMQKGKKIRPGIYCIGDSAHVLTYSPESGESLFSFFDHVSIYVKQLSSLLRWLNTSLKPEEAFIYLYDGRMVGMSEIGSIQVMSSLWCFQLLLAKTTRPYDHRRGI